MLSPRTLNPIPTPAPFRALPCRALAILRGWTAGSGLPDETRASRQVLKDYCCGKLLYCTLPPREGAPGGEQPAGWAPGVGFSAAEAAAAHRQAQLRASSVGAGQAEEGTSGSSAPTQAFGAASASGAAGPSAASRPSASAATASGRAEDAPPSGSSSGDDDSSSYEDDDGEDEDEDRGGCGTAAPRDEGVGGAAACAGASAAGGGHQDRSAFDAADLDLMKQMEFEEAGGKGKAAAAKRPEYKFNKKAARTKGTRGLAKGDSMFGDGAPIMTGKKGGIVRVAGY